MAQTIELADGVYRIATDNYRLNTGLILGLEAALVIDTGAGPRQGTEIYDEVRRLTRLPITVVNTHAHYERFFGNDVFVAMGVEDFWAHPRTVRAIEKYGESQRPYVETLEPEMAHHQGPATDIIVPNKLTAHNGEGITFTPVELGERSATLIYLGQGHTKGDLLVGVEDVLFAGGLLEQGTDPSFDDSYPDRWVETIGALTELDRYSIYVPGRGEPVTCQAVEQYIGNLKQIHRKKEWKPQGSGADFTQILFVEKTGINQAFLREVKVATSKVIGSIAEEDANKYLPAQAAIGRINFVGRKARNLRRRFEYSNHGCSILLSYDFSCGSPQPAARAARGGQCRCRRRRQRK